MPIIRKKQQGGYTVIPNSLLRDQNLRAKDVGILAFLLSLPDDWEFSVSGLAVARPRDGKTAITSSLIRLEELGYLERSRERGDRGTVRGAIWTVYDVPHNQPLTENPNGDNANNKNGKRESNIHSYNVESYKSCAGRPAEITGGRIPRPSIQEIAEYCAYRNNGIDAESFFDFYEANGWVQGKGKPIRDWRAAVRTWERRNKQNGNGGKGNPFKEMLRNGDGNVYEQSPNHSTFGDDKNGVPFTLPECKQR